MEHRCQLSDTRAQLKSVPWSDNRYSKTWSKISLGRHCDDEDEEDDDDDDGDDDDFDATFFPARADASARCRSALLPSSSMSELCHCVH